MNANRYREKVIKVIEDYTQGKIGNNEASDWALEVIKGCDVEKWPKDLAEAVHLLFDLHDKGESWCPGREELKRCKAELGKNISTV